MSEKTTLGNALGNLRTGYIFSLISLLLFLLYSELLLFFLLYLSLVILLTWSYGVYKRSKAWRLLNQGQANLALIVEWIVIFLFAFPFTGYLMLVTVQYT